MENIPKAANPVRRLRRRADAHGRSDIISAHARSDIIERGGFILPAAFAISISKCGLGTFVPVLHAMIKAISKKSLFPNRDCFPIKHSTHTPNTIRGSEVPTLPRTALGQ